MKRLVIALGVSVTTGLGVLAGCGGGDSGAPSVSESPAGGASAGGASMGAGASVGGVGGVGAGGSAAGGKATGGGSPAGGGAGNGGHGGTGTTGGAGGAHGGGSGTSGGGASTAGGAAGKAGGAGANGCQADKDCTPPSTTPPACAVGTCNTTTHACSFAAKDADADGHPTAICKATDGTAITVGDDCDDTNANVHPGAWDGPKGDGHVDECDSIDQDCDGTPDDGKLMSGATCSCAPNDVRTCAQDAGGQPINYPTLDMSGNPLGKYCKLGKQTCSATGQWEPCIGAVGPLPADLCDGLDENCNGKVDTADDVPPVGQITYTFDGDDDNHGSNAMGSKQNGCPGKPPTTCPSFCTLPCDPSMQWRTGTFPLDDCNDNDPNVFPGAAEKCNGVDDDCNGKIDDGASDAKTWVFDYDGDTFGDINIKPIKSCDQPTTVPQVCVDALMNLPSSYCTGLTTEGFPPTCPPPACDVGMWVTGETATDCKDNPGEGGSVEGNKPELVHPGGADLCNGLDYACQGSPDIGCGCSPIGASKSCGDTTTCNAGTETCGGGGVWGSCSGGDPVQRTDYCMDMDADGACDLGTCQSQVCPSEAPSAGGWKPKSLCGPVTDCNDGDKTVVPSGSETCNGDGVDHNCNGNPNTPGAGDCDCNGTGPNTQTMVDCKPPAGYYPPGATPGIPSSNTPGYVMGSALTGVCHWGQAQCDATGHLGACQNASPGNATEICNGDGMDYNCNGTSNVTIPGDCGCTNGMSQPCGTCLLGSQTCLAGQWGTCNGDPGYKTYCADNDNDGYCATATGACNTSACPNDPRVTAGKLKLAAGCSTGGVDCNDNLASVHPSATELCGDGIDEDCDGADSNGFYFLNGGTSVAIGGVCSNGELGACHKTGTVVCGQSGTTTPATCNAGDWSDKASWVNKPTTVMVHGSWDTDCNGHIDHEYGSTVPIGPLGPAILDSGGCQTGDVYASQCAADYTAAGSNFLGFYVICVGAGNGTALTSPDTAQPGIEYYNSFLKQYQVPTCGKTFISVQCYCNAPTPANCTDATGYAVTEPCQ